MLSLCVCLFSRDADNRDPLELVNNMTWSDNAPLRTHFHELVW
jgi:hypothetical protein